MAICTHQKIPVTGTLDVRLVSRSKLEIVLAPTPQILLFREARVTSTRPRWQWAMCKLCQCAGTCINALLTGLRHPSDLLVLLITTSFTSTFPFAHGLGNKYLHISRSQALLIAARISKTPSWLHHVTGIISTPAFSPQLGYLIFSSPWFPR